MPKNQGWWVAVAAAAVLTGCGITAGVGGQVRAEMACESAVTARLKHPDVADFDHSDYRAAEGSDPAVVRGVVKTVNSFNAPVRVTYGCQVRGDRATVTQLSEP